MKTFLILIVLILIALGLYYYISDGQSGNVVIEGNEVTVDAGDFQAVFLASDEFSETFMLFGGDYFNTKNLINPVILFGLGIANAKDIYAQYPDFHRCSSAGASLAKEKIEDLNLIPANESVLDGLKAIIEEFKDSLASSGGRVCVTLTGKILDIQTVEIPEEDIDILDKFPLQDYYLIDSSKSIDCVSLLE